MRTSLNNIKLIDSYILKQMDAGEATLFNARLILEPDLKEDVFWQQKTHDVVQHYGRSQLLKEINVVHNKLFLQAEYKTFRDKILSFFNK